eukprot:TRINITY_DN83818_c0_g1_i1.p1 TRINITY_DN83818_c0_g1~~TRINITY_DN83818_c0_g1_i1.p1  ORF type:complete len:702 (+),score=35.02 TRINITY_DN83818_c0_g1_i1:141-2246(+)
MARRERLLSPRVVHGLAFLYMSAIALLCLRLAGEVHKTCGTEEGCSRQCSGKMCLEKVRGKRFPCISSGISFNNATGMCGSDFPVCLGGTCQRWAAKEGDVFPVVLWAFTAFCLIFALFVHLPGTQLFQGDGFVCRFIQFVSCRDDSLRLTTLAIPFMMTVAFRFKVLCDDAGSFGGFKFYFARDYKDILNGFVFTGFALCIGANLPACGCYFFQDAQNWVIRVSQVLGIVYVLNYSLNANVDGKFRGDPFFLGSGPIFFTTAVFHNNEHFTLLEESEHTTREPIHFQPLATVMLLWKVVVSTVYSNYDEWSTHFSDILFWFLRMLLLSIAAHSQDSECAVIASDSSRYMATGKLKRLESTGGVKGALKAVWRCKSCWVATTSINWTNNVVNSLYFYFTRDTQLSALKPHAHGSLLANPSAIYYGLLFFCVMGVVLGLAKLVSFAIGCSARSVPDRHFRVVTLFKCALVYFKIQLLRRLEHHQKDRWNITIVFTSTMITLLLAAYTSSERCKKPGRSVRMRDDMRSPRGFCICYVILCVSSKAAVGCLLCFSFMNSKFIFDIPDWLLPAFPPFYLFIFTPVLVEACRYIEAHLHEEGATPKLSATGDPGYIRCVALWSAWMFPFQLVANVVLTGVLGQPLFEGLVGPTRLAKGKLGGIQHCILTCLSLVAWLSTVGLATFAAPPASSVSRGASHGLELEHL